MTHYERRWTGQDWQAFAHTIVQMRHGPTNVQRVPDKVRGDGGLEFFTTDGCLIQCYAPQEVVDVAKATSAIKQKATDDLPKLKKYEEVVAGMLQSTKATRWILLCPFFDDKGIIEHVRVRGEAVLASGVKYLAPSFQALIHSQEDFAHEIAFYKAQTATAVIRSAAPDESTVVAQAGDPTSAKLQQKLRHAFPKDDDGQIFDRARVHVRSFMRQQNAVEQLRLHYPVIWERLVEAIASEERRLELIGVCGQGPKEQLVESLTRIEDCLAKDIPTLSKSARTDLANGTLSDWLIRCPLDFA